MFALIDDYQPEDRAATYRAQDRITRKIDAAPVLHSSEIEPYDVFGDMEAWGEAYGCLDDDQDDEEEVTA